MREATGVCLYCGMTAVGVFVHGHVQCEHCGTNIGPCCDGDPGCSVEKSETLKEETPPQVYPRRGGGPIT